MRPPRHKILIAVISVAMLATACRASSVESTGPRDPQADNRPDHTAGPADAPTPTDGGKVIIAIESEIPTADPIRVPMAVSGHMISSAVYDPLVIEDENGQAKPYLATGFEPNADFTQWNIGIRAGVKFHDGLPLDAQTVKANLEANRASPIGGATGLQFIASVVATDPTHVKVTLTQPWATFPNVFLSQVGYIISPKMILDPNAEPIGTGPFRFDTRVKDRYWRFKKNPEYWQKGLPHLDNIEFQPIPDELARLNSLNNGTVDVIHTNKPNQVVALRESDYKLVDYDGGEKDFVLLNTEVPPFNKISARKAIAYATDYERWRKDLNQGLKPKANGPLSPGQPGYEEDTGFPTYDLAKAKQFLKQYESETGTYLEFKYTARNDVENQNQAQTLKEMWEAAGMIVTLETVPMTSMITSVALGKYQLSEWRLFGDTDPLAGLLWIRSTSVGPIISMNFPRFKDVDKIDKFLDAAMAQPDAAKRGDSFRSIGRRLGEELPYIWLGRVDWVLAARPRVNGIYAAADGSIQTLAAKPWIANLWLQP